MKTLCLLHMSFSTRGLFYPWCPRHAYQKSAIVTIRRQNSSTDGNNFWTTLPPFSEMSREHDAKFVGSQPVAAKFSPLPSRRRHHSGQTYPDFWTNGNSLLGVVYHLEPPLLHVGRYSLGFGRVLGPRHQRVGVMLWRVVISWG